MGVALAWAVRGVRASPAPRAATPDRADRLMSADARDAPLADLDERALVEACRANRPGAFDLVVERHRRSVYQLCYRFVDNHEDASDLSQDVFLRAYRGLKNFRGHASLATWLYRIGVNVCLNRVSARTVAMESIDEHPIEDRAELAPDRMLRDERGGL